MINSPTNNSDFGFLTCLRKTWPVIRDHWFVLMLAPFLRDLFSVLAAALAFGLFIDLKGWNIAIAVVVGCLTWSGFQAGYLRFCLNIYRQGKVNWKDLFSCFPFSCRMLIATTCLWIAVIFGLILLIVPGLIQAAKFSLYGLALIDQKLGALKSLLTSYRMLKGFTWYAVALLLIYCGGGFIFNFGGLCLGLGFQSLLVISLCTLYEHIQTREASR